jgi:hypothetical protein
MQIRRASAHGDSVQTFDSHRAVAAHVECLDAYLMTLEAMGASKGHEHDHLIRSSGPSRTVLGDESEALIRPD